MSARVCPDRDSMSICRNVFFTACLLMLSGCTIDFTIVESMKAQKDQVLFVASTYKTCLQTENSGVRCFGAKDKIAPVLYQNPLDDEEIVELRGGYGHRCALASSGKAYCWGNDSSGSLGAGRSFTPSGVYTPVEVQRVGSLQGKTIASLAVGRSFTCVLDTEGGISCWGSNAYGQLGVGTTTTSLVPVSVDATGALAGKNIVKLVAQGSYHICALDDEGAAYCWGDNSDGQVGDNSGVAKVLVPSAVDMSGVLAGKRLVDIALGDKHTCAIADDKKVYCWGANTSGALGVRQSAASLPSAPTPQAVYTAGVLDGKDVVKIGAGINLTCALTSDNLPYCWGNDSSGQLGNGTPKTASTEPVAVKVTGVLDGKSIVDIHVGRYHACVRDDQGAPYCWGSDDSGSLGDGNSSGQQPEPVATVLTALQNDEGFVSLSLETNRSCGLTDKNRLYCWGNSSTSEGTALSTPQPYGWDNSVFPDEELKYIRSMSIGDNQTCYVSSSYRLFCVGNNTDGVLGIGGAVTSNNVVVSPVPVDTSGALAGKKMIEVHAVKSLTYALSDDRKLFVWGSNLYGGIGDGTHGGISGLPVEVDLGGKKVKEIAAGEFHICILTLDKEVYCWGANMYGQAGVGLSDVIIAQPTQVAGLLDGKKVKTIATFYAHTCALTEEGRLYCWGLNYGSLVAGGVIGAGSVDGVFEPIELTLPTDLGWHRFVSLAVSMVSTCALTDEGRAYCWGDNSFGQLGVTGVATSQTPLAVETNKIFSKLVAGQLHVCGHTTDKKVYCWGGNSELQLGDALFTDASSFEPRLVNDL